MKFGKHDDTIKVLIGTLTVLEGLTYNVPQQFAAWHEVQTATPGQTTPLYAYLAKHHDMEDVIVHFETDPIEWVTTSSNYRSHMFGVWGAEDNNCNGQKNQRGVGFGGYDYYQAPGLDRYIADGKIKIDLIYGLELDEFGYSLCSAFFPHVNVEDHPEYYFESISFYDEPNHTYFKDRDGKKIVHILWDQPRFSSYKFYRLIDTTDEGCFGEVNCSNCDGQIGYACHPGHPADPQFCRSCAPDTDGCRTCPDNKACYVAGAMGQNFSCTKIESVA